MPRNLLAGALDKLIARCGAVQAVLATSMDSHKKHLATSFDDVFVNVTLGVFVASCMLAKLPCVPTQRSDADQDRQSPVYGRLQINTVFAASQMSMQISNCATSVDRSVALQYNTLYWSQ